MGLENYKAIIVMGGCQLIYAGVTLSGRAALVQDLSSRVFVVYRQSTAFLLIAPLAFFSSVTVNQNVYFEGLYLASSSAASALGNLVPAITFLIAYLLGLEKVNLRSWRSLAKMMGTVFCVGGAVVMALLKGPKLLNMELIFPTNSIFLQFAPQQDTWVLGCLFLFASTCCWSLWLILQGYVSACYPDHLSLTAWMCLIAAVQSAVLAFFIEPHFNAWKLTSPFQLFCCFYAGLASAVTFFAQAWCIARRGPLFSAMFNPLCTLIVTVFACIFMHEELYTGSLMGGLAVIIGLYMVLWGKAKDHQEIKQEETTQMKHENSTTSSCADNNIVISCRIDLEQPLLSEK